MPTNPKDNILIVPTAFYCSPGASYEPVNQVSPASYRYNFSVSMPVLYISKPLLRRLKTARRFFHNRCMFRIRRISKAA